MTERTTPAAHRSFPTWSGFSWFKDVRRPQPYCLNLALQGGGAHGAFTWGVLDALLEEPSIAFEGLSGSGTGAMNAVVLADGWLKGGRDGARQGLADFWSGIGQHMPFQPNPFDLNALREVVNRQIDFERLRSACPFKLFVGTTQANTGKLRLFRETELSVQVMLALVSPPQSQHPVEIEGEPYWDGGDLANPPVLALLDGCDSQDVLLVLLNPLKHSLTPRTVEEIEARTIELASGAHFLREMRMFAYAHEFSGATSVTSDPLERRLQNMRFHKIDTEQGVSLHHSDTRLLAPLPLLALLRAQGRSQATQWLGAHLAAVGRESTVDVQKYFT